MKLYLKMIKAIPFAAVAGAALTGCVTNQPPPPPPVPVVIKSDPDHADVYRKGSSLGQKTPHTVSFRFLADTWDGELRKEGYVPQSVTVSKNGPREVLVTLEKIIPKITLTSVPSKADVFTPSGAMIGQTPVVISVTNDAQTYQLSLYAYESKSVTLTPSSSKTVEVDLGGKIPGFDLPEAVIVDNRMVVQTRTVFADRDVIERSPSVRAVRRLTDFPVTRVVGGGSLSPDGKRLMMNVFERVTAPDGKLMRYSSLWSIDVGAGGSLLRNTDGDYIDDSPCYSPDGKYVYFAANRSGKNSIFRMPSNGKGGLGLVTPGTTIDRFPSAAPNSETLMWTAYTEGTTVPQLWSLALLPNGLPTGLPLQIREGQGPHWSPDGKTILYCVMDRSIKKLKIWTMLPDGSQPTQLTTGSDANDIDPAWSPDGTKIVFASDRGVANGVHNYDIWIMNADGSNPKQLTTNGSHDDHPVITPDGKTIFFRSNRGLKWDMWVMELAE